MEPLPRRSSPRLNMLLIVGVPTLICAASIGICFQVAHIPLSKDPLGDLLIVLAAVAFSEPDPTLRDVTNSLDTGFPEDATDVELDANLGRNYHINLSFSAPPDTADRFTTSICDGQLLQGFDPFNAKYGKAADEAATIFNLTLLNDRVYGYSPNTPDTYFGNVCWGENHVIYMILVDKTNPDLFNVRFESPNTCGRAKPPIPCP